MVCKEDLGRLAETHFRNLYSSEDIVVQLANWSEISPKITDDQNSILVRPISIEEVREAVFDINPSKCPGPDEMNGYFFQQFWDSTKTKLMKMVEDFFRTGKLEEGINNTNICLIPKKNVCKEIG